MVLKDVVFMQVLRFDAPKIFGGLPEYFQFLKDLFNSILFIVYLVQDTAF